MERHDAFSDHYRSDLDGIYECVDRIVLNGYFILGQHPGGMRRWWRDLTGSDATLDDAHLVGMAGDFSRRLHAGCRKHGIPVIHCDRDTRKDELAQQHLPSDPAFRGLFLVLVAKAPALVWQVDRRRGFDIRRRKPWPYVNHYHFHIVDPDWGHMTIKMSGHPPFGLQVMLNGHEWVERQAWARMVQACRTSNCFTGGSDFPAIDRIADELCRASIPANLAAVVDRWVYSTCLCFALDSHAQATSRFHYSYSCHQLEYSRNLLFRTGARLDEVYQGMIDRSRQHLDIDKLKTIFGWKKRRRNQAGSGKPVRLERILSQSTEHDLTVFKVHFGKITLKIYDKGDRVLRIEAVVHNVLDLRCGRAIGKMPIMLDKLRNMPIDFLNVVHAAHRSFLGKDVLDSLHRPSRRGAGRLAGVDLRQPRMRAVGEALVALAASPRGFEARELVAKVAEQLPKAARYNLRKGGYDLAKMRAKRLVEKIQGTRRYRLTVRGINTVVAWIVLHDRIIRPVLAGAGAARVGRPPKTLHPVDQHYVKLRRQMRETFTALGIAA